MLGYLNFQNLVKLQPFFTSKLFTESNAALALINKQFGVPFICNDLNPNLENDLLNRLRNFNNKITDEIFGVTSSFRYQIDFFNVETGEKIYEIIDEDDIFKGILRTKREKKNIEIITLNEHLAYQRSYGFCSDYRYNNNKWERMSITSDRWSCNIRHFFEMNDNIILVSTQEELYVLFYPQ